MNKASIDKIKSATPFLIWFRRCLPYPLQTQVRPYLDRPYQLALTILDRCDAPQPLVVKDIAERVSVAPQTAKQVLLALKDGGMTFAVSPTREWQVSAVESIPRHSDSTLHDAKKLPSVQVYRVHTNALKFQWVARAP